MDTDSQKMAAWISGVFFGIWIIVLMASDSLNPLNWLGWVFMFSTIIFGFFAGVATEPDITNWTKWVALGSVAVVLQIFLAFTFDYILTFTGLAEVVGIIVISASITFTSWIGGFIIGAYLTRD